MIIGFHHVSVPARDLQTSAEFYHSLGFQEIPRPDTLPSNGKWLQGYGFQIHLIVDPFYQGAGLSVGRLPDKRHFALSVLDAGSFRTYLLEKGIKVSQIIPLGNNAQQFFFLDPSDTPIEANDLENRSP